MALQEDRNIRRITIVGGGTGAGPGAGLGTGVGIGSGGGGGAAQPPKINPLTNTITSGIKRNFFIMLP